MTRRYFAIFFLSIYAVVLFRPLLPFVDYAMNKEYVMKNLCENRNKPKLHCNGKCHLMKQLKMQVSGIDGPFDSNGQKNASEQEGTALHLSDNFKILLQNSSFSVSFSYEGNHNCLPSGSVTGIFHPPCQA